MGTGGERQTDRQRDRETDRQRQAETERQSQRVTDIDRERHRKTLYKRPCPLVGQLAHWSVGNVFVKSEKIA